MRARSPRDERAHCVGGAPRRRTKGRMAADTNTTAQRDLRTLSRGNGGGSSSGAAPAARIPRPTFRWKAHIWLPAGILLAGILLLAHVLGDALRPAIDVRVVPVVVKTTAETGGAVTVQAPG